MPLEKRPLRPLRPKFPPSLSQTPTRKSAYHHLCLDAQQFVTEKNYTTALIVYKKAMQEIPAGDQKALKGACLCYRKLALSALKQRNFKSVQSLLQDLITTPRVDSLLTGKDYCVLAEAAIENKDFQQAKQALEKALMLQPESREINQLNKRLKAEQLHQEMKNLYP